MTDTYDVGSLENGKTFEWEDQGYEEKKGSEIKTELDNNDVETVNEKVNGNDTPDEADVKKLKDNEIVLVLTEDRETEEISEEELELRRQRREKQGELNRVQSDLRSKRVQRREEQEDLEGLEEQLQDVRQELTEINERFQELGLTPPIISTDDINDLDSSDQQEARNMLSRRGSLNNTIGELQDQVEDQRQTVQQLDEEVDEIRNERNNIQEDIQDLNQRIEIIQPITIQTEVLLDIILICTTEWETYISGKYINPDTNNPTRKIMGRGTKSVRMGARAPIQIRGGNTEQQFWDSLYSDIREEVFRDPGNFPQGEWFDRLIQELQSLGPAATQGGFTGSNWDWRFGKQFNDGGGTHEFPTDQEFEDEKNQQCDNWVDVELR